MMAVGLTPSGTSASLGLRHAAEEEARAEVDVLSSRLEKTSQLTKKIEACLNRLDATGKSVREVAGPLSGETKRLQVLGNSASPCTLLRGGMGARGEGGRRGEKGREGERRGETEG